MIESGFLYNLLSFATRLLFSLMEKSSLSYTRHSLCGILDHVKS